MSNFLVGTVSADGLAPLGARPSTDTVTDNSGAIYTESEF